MQPLDSMNAAGSRVDIPADIPDIPDIPGHPPNQVRILHHAGQFSYSGLLITLRHWKQLNRIPGQELN
jgi:hypothetical protein